MTVERSTSEQLCRNGQQLIGSRGPGKADQGLLRKDASANGPARERSAFHAHTQGNLSIGECHYRANFRSPTVSVSHDSILCQEAEQVPSCLFRSERRTWQPFEVTDVFDM